jgi:GntR family transcriptional regulator / MocR family aminotransferase
MDFQFALDPNSTTSLHRQLYEGIRQAILQRNLSAGQRVPSTRALAKSIGVSRATVTTSFEMLLSEGYLEATGGSGTYVCRQLPEELLRTKDTGIELAGEEIRGRSEESSQVDRSPVGWIGIAAQSTYGNNLRNQPKLADRLSWYGSSLLERQWSEGAGGEPEIQFIYGRPDLEHFPVSQWNQLYTQHVKRRDFTVLDAPAKAQGFEPLRLALADYLARARALHCTPEQIIIVSGSQQGIDLVTRVLVDRDDLVGIEEPGYSGAQKALLAQGAKLEPIPVDLNGLKVDELKRRFDGSGKRLQMLYLTPSHQYPTGVVLALSRRLELLAWAQRTGTFLVEDDYDSEYRYKGRPIPALAGLDQGESVIYIGTFSKVLLPCLRLGYLVVPRSLIDVFSRAKWLCDIHSPLIEQQVLADFIKLGHMERHLRRMRSLYEVKRKLVVATLKSCFGARASILGDNAGINVLVRFQTDLTDDDIEAGCRSLGVGLRSTRESYLLGGRPGEFLINYGGLGEGDIVEGLRRVAEVIV